MAYNLNYVAARTFELKYGERAVAWSYFLPLRNSTPIAPQEIRSRTLNLIGR